MTISEPVIALVTVSVACEPRWSRRHHRGMTTDVAEFSLAMARLTALRLPPARQHPTRRRVEQCLGPPGLGTWSVKPKRHVVAATRRFDDVDVGQSLRIARPSCVVRVKSKALPKRRRTRIGGPRASVRARTTPPNDGCQAPSTAPERHLGGRES